MEIKHLYVITHKFIGQHASDILNKWSMCQVCHMKIVERDQKKKSFSSELQSFELLCNIHGKIYVLLFNQQSNNFESKRREFKRKDTHLQKPYTFNDSKSFCITPIWQQKLPVRRKKKLLSMNYDSIEYVASCVSYIFLRSSSSCSLRLHVVSARVIYEMEAIKQNLYLKSLRRRTL